MGLLNEADKSIKAYFVTMFMMVVVVMMMMMMITKNV